ncbi:MAG: hypothetical protein FVQ83_15630 [Chloroflexi bacterium]|nr:hypothetical protein [Chloroflexota bacterium]
MPSYNFKCNVCGQVFEKHLPVHNNQKIVACPNGHKHVERVYSAPAIVFKGSGFYLNDNRPRSSKNKAVK